MSQPVFLTLYAIGLVAAVLLGLRVKRVGGTERPEPLSYEEIGYLGGGPVRAAEVAVSGLVSENRARFSGDQLAAVGPAEPTGSPLQAVVLAQLGSAPRVLDEVVATAAGSAAARQTGHRLLADGFLVAPGQRARRAVLAVLPLLALAGVLVVAGDWTVWTVCALVLTGALAAILLATPPPVLTTAGAHAYWAATVGLAPVDPAEITARYGLRRQAAPKAERRPPVEQTALFDGEDVERIDHSAASNEALPRPRRSVVTQQQPRRVRGALWAGGWFAGGWLASSWLSEGGDDGDLIDLDFSGFGDA